MTTTKLAFNQIDGMVVSVRDYGAVGAATDLIVNIGVRVQ